MKDFFSRYADRVMPGAPDACWEWTGAKASKGYGHTHLGNVHIYAHRAAYESVHGVGSADGWVVRHRCDNPPCCNPNHLQIGTQSDNAQDAIERGRWGVRSGRRGEASPTAKLSNAQVREISARLQQGAIGTHLAAEFGVEKSTISRIKKGRRVAA